MYAPFSITVTTTAQKLTFLSESDSMNPGSASYAEHVGYSLEFDVGTADIYCGPDASVTATGTSYNNMAGGAITNGTLGRKYSAGTHVEITLNKEDIIYAVTASGTSIVVGSAVGV